MRGDAHTSCTGIILFCNARFEDDVSMFVRVFVIKERKNLVTPFNRSFVTRFVKAGSLMHRRNSFSLAKTGYYFVVH